MRMKGLVPAALTFVLLALAARSAAAQAAAPTADELKQFDTAWAQQPRVDTGVPAGTARVVIVKFNDFACPMCAAVEEWYGPVLEKFEASHPGAVKYVFRDWPFASECNRATRGIPGHEGACNAAAAARMAEDVGKRKEMVAWLFANQGVPPAAVAEAATRILSLAPGEFEKNYALARPEIEKDVEAGMALDIRGTPTFFINGVRLPGAFSPVYFERAITLELARAGS